MAGEGDGALGWTADTTPSDSPPDTGDDPLESGSRVTDELSVVRHLGKGGQGDVYEVFDASTGSCLAIKVLRRHLVTDSDVVARLQREAATASAIDHPNVTRIFGLERSESGDVLIRMELLDGEPLYRALKRGPMPVEEVCDLVRQMAEGLGAAHSLGIIHRDVKPANVFLTSGPEGRTAKIMDFGIAKAAASWDLTALTHTGSLVGTPAYMSPEQILLPDQLDHRTDIYSLGLVFWEMLTGRRVFGGREVAQILMRQVKSQPPDPRTIRREIPRPIASVVMRCLAKRPESRFSTMRALVERLDQARHEPDTPTLEDPDPPPVVAELRGPSNAEESHLRPPPPAPSNWLLPAAGALAAAVIVASAGVMLAGPGMEAEAPVVDVASQPEAPPPPPSAPPPPPPAVAPEPQANGVLHLTSEPEGVAVFLAGAVLGKTPLEVPLASGVEHELTVRRDGYESATFSVRVKPGEDWRRHVVLQRERRKVPKRRRVRPAAPPPPPSATSAATHGWARINTVPWTEVYFQGQPIGTTPIGKVKLPVGRHKLRFVNKARGLDVQRVVEIRGEVLEKLRFDFEK